MSHRDVQYTGSTNKTYSAQGAQGQAGLERRSESLVVTSESRPEIGGTWRVLALPT